MKRYPLFFLLYLLCYSLHSQDTAEVTGPNYIPILTYWNVGDTFRYAVEKGEKKFKEGVLIDSTGKQYDMTLVVSEATDSSYVVRVFQEADWSEMIQLLSKSNIKVGDLKPLIKILDFEHLEYVIDENGSFRGIKNLEKLLEVTSLILDKYIEANYKSVEERQQAEAAFTSFTRPDLLNAKLLEEIIVMHKLYGLQYAQDSTFVYDQEAPDPSSPDKIFRVRNQVVASVPEDWDGLVRLHNHIIVKRKDALSLVRPDEPELYSKTEAFFAANTLRYEVNTIYSIDPDTGNVHLMDYRTCDYMGDLKLKETFVVMTLAEK